MKAISRLALAALVITLIVASCQNDSSLVVVQKDHLNGAFRLQFAEIGDYVWNDANMNGIQDEGEEGVGGVTVNLYNDAEELITSAVTDEDGEYEFQEIDPGDYYIEFVLPDDYMFSPMDEGDDDTIDSDADPETGWTELLTLEADMEYPDIDAGMYMIEDQEGCTYGKGFWARHCGFGPQNDLVTNLLPLWLGNDTGESSIAVETAEMAQHILLQGLGDPSNGVTRLYAHFLAAKLNIANGASAEDIADLVVEADDFLAENDWEDWHEFDEETRQMINMWKDTFEDYNEGEIGPGHCDHDDDGGKPISVSRQ